METYTTLLDKLPLRSSKVYIAASFANRAEARRVRDLLVKEGFVSTARWIDTHLSDLDALSDDERAREALEDLRGVAEADWMLFINDPFIPSTSGGQHIEFGYAVALEKPILMLGVRNSVFHYLPHVLGAEDGWM